jgi:pSer/pThr/pTyr-binding forkhead associated (FHA) protein
MARLVVSPEGEAKAVSLSGEIVSMGRDPTNGIALAGETKASRRHAQVVPVSGGWEVVDLESTNGTRVNGDSVKRRRLSHGDVIEVGTTRIRYEDEEAAARAATTKDVCYLEHAGGDRKGERIPLTATRTTFGRRESNTVPLNDKMASGHHAEIVRDLNGYTVRDLGSTNGTLVNGEPTTEAHLAHGTRIRIGNSRFVFKDPSMADVDVELAGLPEEDAGWGMMAEIDVGRVKSGAGGMLGAAALVAGLAGLAWWAATRQDASPEAGGGADLANQVTDPGFDTPEGIAWTAPEDSPLAVARVEKGGRSGGALSVRHRGEEGAGPAAARSADDLEIIRSSTYRVSAWMRPEGEGRADLAVQWIGRSTPATTGGVQTVPVASAPKGGGAVEAVVWPPPWADTARLAIVVGPGSGVVVDDVRFAVGAGFEASSKRLALPGDKAVVVTSRGGVDLLSSGGVLFLGGAPWARMPGGRTLGGPTAFVPKAEPSASADAIEVAGDLVDARGAVPATVRWKVGAEGASVSVSVAGAEEVGLSADFPRDHVEQVSALGAFTPQRLPPEPGTLEGVRKVLAGDPKPTATRPATLVAIETAGDASDATLRIARADDPGLLRISLGRKGSEAAFTVVTNLEAERQRAQAELDVALRGLDTSPGQAIEALRRVADGYPFHDAIRREALDAIGRRTERADKDLKELKDLLDAFAVYGSGDVLREASTRAERLATQFPVQAGNSLADRAADLVKQARVARVRHAEQAAEPEVRRLVRLAQMLEGEPGYEPVAAVYYDEIVRRFRDLPPDSPSGKRVAEAEARLKALLEKPQVSAAFPRRHDEEGGK